MGKIKSSKVPPHGACIFCPFVGELTKEHILPHWMRPHLPSYDGVAYEGKLWRRTSTGEELPPQVKSLKGTGEHRSQTLKVVCAPCNNVWMSQIVNGVRAAIEPLMLGRWDELSVEVQRKIATWFALHNMVYEQFWSGLQITSEADRRKFMADRDPGARRFIWIAKTSDGSAIPTFARFMGSGKPGVSSQMTLVLAAAVGQVALISIYDPSGVIVEERMQRIEELLNMIGLRVWPLTENPVPPQKRVEAEALNYFLTEIEQIIRGGESKYAKEVPAALKQVTEMVRRQAAAGLWPPKGF